MIATATGDITMNLQTKDIQQWSVTVFASDLLGGGTNAAAPAFSQWDCLLNCAVENVGGAVLGELVEVIGKLQTFQACMDWLITGSGILARLCRPGAWSGHPLRRF